MISQGVPKLSLMTLLDLIFCNFQQFLLKMFQKYLEMGFLELFLFPKLQLFGQNGAFFIQKQSEIDFWSTARAAKEDKKNIGVQRNWSRPFIKKFLYHKPVYCSKFAPKHEDKKHCIIKPKTPRTTYYYCSTDAYLKASIQ